MNIWELLEQDAPPECEAIERLYSWSTNFEPGTGPFSLFLDLIGWSDDVLGEPLYDLRRVLIGWVEAAKLGDALKAWADSPLPVREYVDRLMEAEQAD